MEDLKANTAGFIGSALPSMSFGTGNDDSDIDNHSEYYSPRLKEDRLASRIEHTIDTHPPSHLTYSSFMDELFRLRKIILAVNLAAQASIRYSINVPLANASSTPDCSNQIIAITSINEI